MEQIFGSSSGMSASNTRTVRVLGKDYDLRHHSRQYIEEWTSAYLEEVTAVLERVPETRCDIPESLYKRFQLKHDIILQLPPRVIYDIGIGIHALYFPRFLPIWTNLLKQFHMERSRTLFPKIVGVFQSLCSISMGAPTRDVLYFYAYLSDSSRASALGSFVLSILLEEMSPYSQPEDLQLSTMDFFLQCLAIGRPIPTSEGGDAHSCLRGVHREILEGRVVDYIDSGRVEALPQVKQDQVHELVAFLAGLKTKGVRYWKFSKKTMKQQFLGRCSSCEEKPFIGVCGRCQTAQYCSRRCQREDWAVYHRIRCFKTNFRGIEPPTTTKSASV